MVETIRALRVAPVLEVQLPRPWGADVLSHRFIAVDVEDSAGAIGHGFSWTPSIGAASVAAMLDNDVRSFAIGRETDPDSMWDPLWRHLHEAGSAGVTTIAMAALDLALWDLRSRRLGMPVADLIGRRRTKLRVYGSGVNRHLDDADLLAQVSRWIAAGFDAVKVKVGGRDLADDVRRVAAVRTVLGPERELMIDANQLWSLDEARRAIDALSPFDLTWLEEPLVADDLTGYTHLSETSEVPIAAGENIATVYRFTEFFDAGVLAVAQPNVIRVGGITPFLRIAKTAEKYSVPIHPHLLPELSGQLAMCLADDPMLEHVEESSLGDLGILSEPAGIVLEGASAHSTNRPGIGVVLTVEDDAL